MSTISKYQHQTNPDCPSVKTHGFANSHRKWGCTCPEAVAAYEDRMRRNREKWRQLHGPGDPATSRTFLPEDGILDEVAIDCMVTGSRQVRRTRRERNEAVRRLALDGYDVETIGNLVHTDKGVVREMCKALKSSLPAQGGEGA